jgi:hypothetical protein
MMAILTEMRWNLSVVLICISFINAETLKQQRPIGEGDQELEKRVVGEEST